MRHVCFPCLLFFAAAVGVVAGCADPSPTFVFDAAPIAREAGTDAGAGGAGVQDGAVDGGTDGQGDAL
jgi:hypothetical protein